MNPLMKPIPLSVSVLARVQYLCAFAAGALEFLNLVLPCGITYALLQRSLLLLAAVFWMASAILLRRSRRRCPVILPFVMVLWFVIVQQIPHVDQLQLRHYGFFFGVYLLAYPYAVVTDDAHRQMGLRTVAAYLIAASLVLTFYGFLLVADLVPDFMESAFELYWCGARINPVMHPNYAARVFLIGIAFCFGFCFRTAKKWLKALLLAAVVLQFLALSLTNSRSTIIFACLLIGGTAFFTIFKGTARQLLLGAATALALTAALLLVHQAFFRWNTNRLTAAQSQGEVAEAVQTDSPSQLLTEGGQGTLAEDMSTMNGRTRIWRAALEGLRKNPSILIRGADSVRELIGNIRAVHLHNAWLQTLCQLGLPAFVISLIFTAQALCTSLFLLFHRGADLWKKLIAMLMLCLLASALVEPVMFYTGGDWNFADFTFFLCLGYAAAWRKQLAGIA